MALKDLEVRLEKAGAGIVDEEKQTKPVTTKDFFERYLTYCRTNLAQRSYRRYQAAIDNFNRFLKNKHCVSRLTQIIPEILEDYKTFRREEVVSSNGHQNTEKRHDVKANTLNFELGVFRTAFNTVITWGYVHENPIQHIKFLEVRDAKTHRFLSKEKVAKLLEESPDDFRNVPPILLHTGMRKGELRNLEWSDIDLLHRKIKIGAKKDRHPKGTGCDIPISNNLLPILEEMNAGKDCN